MARKTSSFLVGLFVIIGVLLLAGSIVWIGVTGFFMAGNTYVTYLDESVQGLQRDSTVRFRGVEVGRVEAIRIAPDNRLVAVIMRINMPGDLTQTTVAQLVSAGITGLMFIDLDYRHADAPDLSPKLTFPSEYPVIPSRPSEFSRILTGINEVINRLNAIDVQGIANQLQQTLADIGGLFKDQKVHHILSRLEQASANIQSLTGKADQALDRAKVDGLVKEITATVRETKAAVSQANEFVTKLTGQLEALKLPETMTRTRGILLEAQVISDNLRRATASLEQFTQRIAERPPDLLFGKPPVPRWNESKGTQRP